MKILRFFYSIKIKITIILFISSIKDYILRFIPKRITSFRLCPSTRLQLAARAGSGPGGELTLDDGVQPALRLWSAERDLLAAAFTQLLLANCGGEDGFKVTTLCLITPSIPFQ